MNKNNDVVINYLNSDHDEKDVSFNSSHAKDEGMNKKTRQ